MSEVWKVIAIFGTMFAGIILFTCIFIHREMEKGNISIEEVE